MDVTTEPIIAVIGHPIAGNPAQFAVERALQAMNCEWRVLSFDVEPEDIAAALEGFAVTGIAGVLIDLSVAAAASTWYSDRSRGAAELIDCLHRDEENRLMGTFQQRAFVDDQIVENGDRRIWFGQPLDDLAISRDLFPIDAEALSPVIEDIKSANSIIIAPGETGPVELDADEWPSDDGSTLVVDFTIGHPDVSHLAKLGYRVITPEDCRIGMLHYCLKLWTGRTPPPGVVHDAVEEYFGV